MEFNERLKQLRGNAGLTQRQIADELGITIRAYQYYEEGKKYPPQPKLIKLTEILGATPDELLSVQDQYLMEADEKGDSRDKRRIRQLVGEMHALFAGGELSDEDKDAAMRALNDAYWTAKEMNKETYTPKKYQNRGTDGQ